MYYGSELCYGFETMMTIAVGLDSPLKEIHFFRPKMHYYWKVDR